MDIVLDGSVRYTPQRTAPALNLKGTASNAMRRERCGADGTFVAAGVDYRW
jgi:hypothetical protein